MFECFMWWEVKCRPNSETGSTRMSFLNSNCTFEFKQDGVDRCLSVCVRERESFKREEETWDHVLFRCCFEANWIHKVESEGLSVNACVGRCMTLFLFWGVFVCLFVSPYDCFCCTDTCQNSMTILKYFMEYINDLHTFLSRSEENW